MWNSNPGASRTRPPLDRALSRGAATLHTTLWVMLVATGMFCPLLMHSTGTRPSGKRHEEAPRSPPPSAYETHRSQCDRRWAPCPKH